MQVFVRSLGGSVRRESRTDVLNVLIDDWQSRECGVWNSVRIRI